jgi:hypothetical protein
VREEDTLDDADPRRGGNAREAASSCFVRYGKKLGRARIVLYKLGFVVSSHVIGTDRYRVFQYSSKASSF